MPLVFVITESGRFNNSVARYFRHTRGMEAASFVLSRHAVKSQSVIQTFRQIVEWMMRQIEGDPRHLCQAIAIIDLYDAELPDLSHLNPLDNTLRAGAVAAMLVLAFPEIHWVFHTPHRIGQADWLSPAHLLRAAEKPLDEIVSLSEELFCPLFDPTGLRNAIREQIKRNGNTQNDAPYLPVRQETAAALDEEVDYAFFNAYATYRFGFRCHVVSSYKMMERLFMAEEDLAKRSASPPAAPLSPQISLTFEDVFLKYPDVEAGADGTTLSFLEGRDEQLKKLKKVKRRVFVTVGHGKARGEDRWKQNEDYRIALGEQRIWTEICVKPFSGIFYLWENSGLSVELDGSKHRMGYAPQFQWPPNEPRPTENSSSHSSPGRMLAIASCLIQRAVFLRDEAKRVPDAVYGATLAMESAEYLGHRTPTTSLEALALKHQLEVKAECLFYGIEYSMNVGSRLYEIEQEVRSIGYWFREETQLKSELNAEISIVSELVLNFRDYNQFDEEQICLSKVRTLYRRIWCLRQGYGLVVSFPLLLLRTYIEFLMGGFRRFTLALIFWVSLLALAYGNVPVPPRPSQNEAVGHITAGVAEAIISFFGIGAAPDTTTMLQQQGMPVIWLSVFATLLGFLHLGIFVSYLYTLISRR